MNNRIGPDFFGFYASEVAELLSRDEDLLPSCHSISHSVGNLRDEVGKDKVLTKNSITIENKGINAYGSLFSNGIGALLSEFKRERLKSLLRQSVFTLTKEVDEMIDPVVSICRIRSCLKCKEYLLSLDYATCKVDPLQQPHKKLRCECSVSISL
ncbi:hypothetical protein OROMI_032373 [Orobanche minor]